MMASSALPVTSTGFQTAVARTGAASTTNTIVQFLSNTGSVVAGTLAAQGISKVPNFIGAVGGVLNGSSRKTALEQAI